MATTTTRRQVTLTVGGPRTKITPEEAQQVLERFEKEIISAEENVVVTKIDLSCRQWCVEAIQVLQPLLEKVAPHVIVLDLDDTIAGLETSLGLEIFQVLASVFDKAQNLQEIRLSDNAMGPRALEKVAPLLSSPKLQRLYLNNCGLSAETIPQLNQALQVVQGGEGPGIARLSTLALNKNMIGVPGAQHMGELLPHCTNLKSFSYCGCRPTFDGSQFLATGLLKLAQNTTGECVLEELSLYDCTLVRNDQENEALVSLAKALEKCPNLTLLNLRDVGELGESGASILTQALLTSGCKLVSLDLSGCGLTPDGAEALKELLAAQLDTLQTLQLETNELGNDGVESILAPFADNAKNVLEHLRLDENELDEGVIDAFLNTSLPNLRRLTLKDNMDLADADDDKKEQLKAHFASAKIYLDDDDDEEADAKNVEKTTVKEQDTDVGDLATLFGKTL